MDYDWDLATALESLEEARRLDLDSAAVYEEEAAARSDSRREGHVRERGVAVLKGRSQRGPA